MENPQTSHGLLKQAHLVTVNQHQNIHFPAIASSLVRHGDVAYHASRGGWLA